ncbi:Acyl carrier protein [Corynebacterium capitovis DSM 44611]|uniref:acyl carrier protein n=1 Tax=Corynebacterium capitovis TaxID=131081 RepID=UPI000378C346|nr:acyl carrier protein [Corynebacterium capitovis]WKD57284.1 Acyl carrier protein [Corynebacterium capitovis DSM 44611]
MELSQRLDLGAFTSKPEGPAATQSDTERLIELISRFTDVPVTPDKTLDELGITSLDRIELAVRAEEEFGIPAEESSYAGSPTAADLVAKLPGERK